MQSLSDQNVEKNENQNPLKKWVVILGILSGLFFLSTLYFGFFAKPVTNKEYIKVADEKESLQAELDNLLAEHERIKAQYGDLTDQLSAKDSIIMANAAEIEQLINTQADYNKITETVWVPSPPARSRPSVPAMPAG